MKSAAQKRQSARGLRLSGAVDRVNLNVSVEKFATGLPDGFVLHDVQGYEPTQIADIMGCVGGKFRSRIA